MPCFVLAVAAFVVGLVLIVSRQPSNFRYVRNTTVSAPPAVVFGLVNDLHRFQEWSPWAKVDPAAKTTFEGPAAGAGAIFHWHGNKKVGTGSMILTESRPAERIVLRLEFLRPFKATNTVEFAFRPGGGQTTVMWSMTGRNNFMRKAFGLVLNFDRLIGRNFEKGLASLKSLAEAAAKK